MPSGKENAEKIFEVKGYTIYKTYHGNWALRRQGHPVDKEISLAWNDHEIVGDRITLDLMDDQAEAELVFNDQRQDSASLMLSSFDSSRADSGAFIRVKIPKNVYYKIRDLINHEEMIYG